MYEYSCLVLRHEYQKAMEPNLKQKKSFAFYEIRTPTFIYHSIYMKLCYAT